MNFPKSTELPLKFIAKEKFYGHGDFSAKLKALMAGDIAKITASNKLSAGTLNIPAGKDFPEIMVLRVALKKKKYSPRLLDAMDKSIRAAFVLFILDFNGQFSASIAFKEKNGDNITIVKRWSTDWAEDLDFQIEGRTVDAVYEGFIRQISGGLVNASAGKSLKEKIANAIDFEKTEKQIMRLEAKMKNEPQLKKKLEIKSQIKNLRTNCNG